MPDALYLLRCQSKCGGIGIEQSRRLCRIPAGLGTVTFRQNACTAAILRQAGSVGRCIIQQCPVTAGQCGIAGSHDRDDFRQTRFGIVGHQPVETLPCRTGIERAGAAQVIEDLRAVCGRFAFRAPHGQRVLLPCHIAFCGLHRQQTGATAAGGVVRKPGLPLCGRRPVLAADQFAAPLADQPDIGRIFRIAGNQRLRRGIGVDALLELDRLQPGQQGVAAQILPLDFAQRSRFGGQEGVAEFGFLRRRGGRGGGQGGGDYNGKKNVLLPVHRGIPIYDGVKG